MASLKPYKKLLLAVFFMLVSIPLFSQFTQSNRFEKELKYHDNDFTVIPLSIEGIALVREKNKFKSGKQFWEIILLDTALHEKASLEIEIQNGNELTGFEYEPGLVHLLFLRKETKGEMSLYSIDLKNHDIQFNGINVQLNFTLTKFFKAGNNFALGGYVNLEPVVLLYVSASKNIKIVPGFFLKNTELIDMRVNQNQTFNTVLLEKNDKGTRKITFRTYDANGKLLFDNVVDIDEDITLQNGISSALKRDDLMIAGTWGKRNAKQSIGFYTLSVNPFAEQKINRIYFGQLNHYLDYLKPKKAVKIKLQTQDALQEGKFPDFSCYVMPFKILENNKGFLVLAELYTIGSNAMDNKYPGGVPYYSYLYHGSYPNNTIRDESTPNDPTSILGSNTIESVLLSVDPNGAVLWDYSIKLLDIERPHLEQITDIYFDNTCIQFLYRHESTLKLKKIDLAIDKTTDFSEAIYLLDPLDIIQSEKKDEGEVRNWFGKNFYAWGFQSIRNRKNGGKTRDVFYINKVAVF